MPVALAIMFRHALFKCKWKPTLPPTEKNVNTSNIPLDRIRYTTYTAYRTNKYTTVHKKSKTNTLGWIIDTANKSGALPLESPLTLRNQANVVRRFVSVRTKLSRQGGLMADLTSLTVYCSRLACGDPVPFTNMLRKRRMNFVGSTFFGGKAIYLCPVCARRRFFIQTLFGGIKETN